MSLSPEQLMHLQKDVDRLKAALAYEPVVADDGKGKMVSEIQDASIAEPLARLLLVIPALFQAASMEAKLAWRGVVDPCVRCGGAGQLLYGDTATWRRGGLRAGHQPTRDVCDLCWGTGDRWRIGVDLRRMREEEDARIAAAALTAVADHGGVPYRHSPAWAKAFAAKLRDLVEPAGRKRAVIEGSDGSIVLSLAALIERAANAPAPGNPPDIRPSERSQARRETPEAERLLRAGYEIACFHAVAGVCEDAATAELDAAIATATESRP